MKLAIHLRTLNVLPKRMPVISGIAANFFNQLVTAAIQIASIPIFLHYWDAETYGRWLLLSAVPAYFAMSDFGIAAVAMNKICMAWARDDKATANVTFQTALLGLTLFILGGAVLAAIGCIGFPPSGDEHAAAALVLLILTAFLNMYSTLYDACFRLVDRYAYGIFIQSSARLVEWTSGLTAVVLGGHFLTVALAMFCTRLVLQVAFGLYSRTLVPDLHFSFRGASFRELKELLPMGIAYLGFPLGSALGIQGLTLIVGHAIGAQEVVVFTAYRTLSRSITQLIQIVSASVWPRFSLLYGLGEIAQANHLRVMAERGVAILACICFVGLWLAGQPIIAAWGHGKLPYQPTILLPLLISTVITALYQIKLIALVATNRHAAVSLCFCLTSAAGLASAWFFTSRLGVVAPIATVIGIELAMAVIVHYAFARQAGISVKSEPATVG